ncbi:HEAT repeat domain-containing protein [Candidatus Sumerlaeota bacterium]|nr:HEAT repeat domain-containing protein [Candidatus Sumerlaeota bacterium]
MATSFSEIDDVYVDMAPLGSLVVSRLHSTDRQEQLWAVRVLENSGEDAKDTVWDLVKLLETNDDELRNAALSAIWHVGRPYDDVPPLLVPYFRSSDPKIRREASECIKLFGEQGHKVTGLWLEALHDPDLGIRMDAAQALEHIVSEHPDERIFAEFLRILQDPLASAEIRAWAASGLSRLRPPSAEAVDALTSASQSSDEALARCANSSLSELEKGKADSIKNVLQSYRSSTGEKRQAIVRRLGALGVQASEAVPELLKDMEGPDEYLAEAAAEALALIAPEMPRPILVLNMMLYYDNQSIACIAADFLEKKVDSKSTPGILEGLKNPGSARWALSRLSRFGPQDKRAIPLLLEGLKNDHPDVRKGACVGLGKIGDATPEVIAGLESGLTDKDDKVRGCATIALLNLDPESERGIKSLAELITSGDRETRIAIIVASTDLKRSDEQVIEAIKKAESDEDANVRNTAKDSLLKIRKGNAAKNLQ